MTALLNPKLWIGLAIAAALAFSHFFVYRSGKATVRNEFDAYKIDQQEQRILADRANRNTERSWQDKADQSTKAKDEQILNINARLADAVGRLSDRAARPTIELVPANPGAVASSTGAGLYREDGRFLIGEAATAARIAAERDGCYETLDGLRTGQQVP